MSILFLFYVIVSYIMNKEQQKIDHLIINSRDGNDYLVALDAERIGGMSKDLFHKQIVDVLYDVLDAESITPGPSPFVEYLWPRKGTVTPTNSKLLSIFSTINDDLKQCLLSVEPYKPYEQWDLIDPMTQQVQTLDEVVSYNTNIPTQDLNPEYLDWFGIELLQKLNKEHGLALNPQKIEYFVHLFDNKYKRVPTFSELHMFAQINSEHCRHNIFNGVIVMDKVEYKKSMFSYIKETYKNNPWDVVVAYSDNWAVLKAENGRYLVIKCETHNHPSMIEPFAWWATWSWWDYRDILATWRGAEVEASTSAYAFGNIMLDTPYNKWHKTPLEILIRAARWVNYYGNCFAAPMINGSVTAQIRDFTVWWKNIWFAKPVVMAWALWSMPEVPFEKLAKSHLSGLIHIKLWWPDYRIGIGWAAASSMNAWENSSSLDFASVQRPDPQMQTKVKNVIEKLLHQYPDAIQNIHDYGAGWHGTNIFELAEWDETHPWWVSVDMARISVKDTTMKYHEIMINESQERIGMMINPDYLPILEEICKKEKCPFDIFGTSTDTWKVHIYDSRTGKDIVNVDVDDFILKEREYFQDSLPQKDLKPLDINGLTTKIDMNDILRHPTVWSKGWLVNHVDRSVRGKIAQQQTVWPRQLPVADYAVLKLHQDDMWWTLTAQGSRPFHSVISPEKMVRFALTEVILNSAFWLHRWLDKMSLSWNWMWSAKTPWGKAELYHAVKALSEDCISLNINIPVGKDSCSMQVAKDNGEKIDAPGNLTLSAFVHMDDVTKKVTPDLKNIDAELIYIPVQTKTDTSLLSRLLMGLNGSVAAQLQWEFGNKLATLDLDSVKNIHNIVQKLLTEDMIVAGHDISEWGLYATLTEMFISWEAKWLSVHLPTDNLKSEIFWHKDSIMLLSEHPWVVLQVPKKRYAACKKILGGMECYTIGQTSVEVWEIKPFSMMWFGWVKDGFMTIHSWSWPLVKWINALLPNWNQPTTSIESKQSLIKDTNVDEKFILPQFTVGQLKHTIRPLSKDPSKIKIAILVDEWTNGQHDMRYIWNALGCKVEYVRMTDLLDKTFNVGDFDVIVWPWWFSYGDVPRSGKWVASVITHNDILQKQFDQFFSDPKKASLRVCNGNQIQQELGYITKSHGLPRTYPMLHNKSWQFESRFLANKIINDDNIRFKGMKDEIRGLWSAHGEWQYPSDLMNDMYKHNILFDTIVPIVYVDSTWKPTQDYPYNPNWSLRWAAWVISKDGRHLSMMPHPERTVLDHQLPWKPDTQYDYTRYQMFKNLINNI